MANWVFEGLRTGIRTTNYPRQHEDAPGVSPGRPQGTSLRSAKAVDSLVKSCPANAISQCSGGIEINHGRCVHCFRCRRGVNDGAVAWDTGYEWATTADTTNSEQRKLDSIFGRSLHIRFVDAGACGACMSEARQINNPYYNMHRLGFFITPTPRNADVLLVAGPVSDAMRLPLRKAYEAMPTPKRVVAIGVCAISGGVFGPSFAASGGVSEIIPVDVVVPGCPPPPLAILHALLVIVEKIPPSALVSSAPERSAEPA
jgi:Ni,Fe-hydrogenase III small subunit/ferredoxin-like protein FixX